MGAALVATWAGAVLEAGPAAASKLPAFADSAWEALGGGPSDLTFPDAWLGTWDVTSTLTKVDTPLGRELLPRGGAVVARAEREDLGKPIGYRVAFMRNGAGRVIYDRRFNTAALMESYYGSRDWASRISWNPDDPNVLSLAAPKGLQIRTRVTRRSEGRPEGSIGGERLETSEFMEEVFDDTGSGEPTVKASQVFTKYVWRAEEDAAADGGPAILATQVVSDYLTAYDGESAYLAAGNRPVVLYTYRLAFRRHVDGSNSAAAAPPSIVTAD